MSGRFLSMGLPHWPIERMRLRARRCGQPFPDETLAFALIAPSAGGPRVTAASEAARLDGIRPGMGLADARAILPALELRAAEPETDARALDAFGHWCMRYTPKVALDGASDLMLDITGCAHLLGGEAGLLADLDARLAERGLSAQLAIADRQAEAWARGRFGRDVPLMSLPVQALRIEAETAAALIRLGLKRVGDLDRLPRRALLSRFGAGLVGRLEALLGETDEPFTPLRARPCLAASLSWPEPIGRTEDIEAAVLELTASLCRELERAVLGARQLDLLLFRVDGEAIRLQLRTGRPAREPGHLSRLLAMQLDGLDIGFGIELMRLEVVDAVPLTPLQADLAASQDEAALAQLVDRLQTRLGKASVARLEPVASHIPERAQRPIDPAEPAAESAWLATRPRPLRLLARPRTIQAMAQVPDGPPLRLDGMRVREAEGPERIEHEWWRSADEAQSPARDYWQVTDETGRRSWVFREGVYGDGSQPVWRLHGTFQ